MGNWMTPLARSERLLVHRLLALESELPRDQPMDPRWNEYTQTILALTHVLNRVRPLTTEGFLKMRDLKGRTAQE
jgi:hypothetical protein